MITKSDVFIMMSFALASSLEQEEIRKEKTRVKSDKELFRKTYIIKELLKFELRT